MYQTPFVRKATEDNMFRSLGNKASVLVSGADTGGSFAIVQIEEQKGCEPPPHIHHNEDETFYVVDGEVTYFVGDQEIHATPGTYLFAPRGIQHTFKLKTPTANVIVSVHPAGFETFVQEMGQKLPNPIQPDPASPPNLNDILLLVEIAKKYGIEIKAG
jgi:quercetin dioxygenase-like cupin family protein